MLNTKRILNIKSSDGVETSVYLFHVILNDFNLLTKDIDEELSDIWDPELRLSLDHTKKSIYQTIKTKNNDQKHSMCSEFFMHLFFRSKGFSQASCFTNLEEKSQKKGFDGVYQKDDLIWFAENKSAITPNKHKNKINEALNDIENRFKNTDPWPNALHHWAIREKYNLKLNISLKEKIRLLSEDYLDDVKHDSSEFNIIPVSTLFVGENQTDDEIEEELKSEIEDRKFKSMIVLCIDNNVYDKFIEYLEGNV